MLWPVKSKLENKWIHNHITLKSFRTAQKDLLNTGAQLKEFDNNLTWMLSGWYEKPYPAG